MRTKLFMPLLSTITLFSCNKDELNEVDLSPEVQPSYLTAAEIKGVWTDKENEHFFISIGTDGKYSFCFTQELMGSGEYKINKNKITFNNKYLSTTDNAQIEIIDGALVVSGNFQLFKQDRAVYINKIFKKTDEEIPLSIVGEQWRSSKYLIAPSGDARDYLDVLSEYIIKYKKVKVSGSIETQMKEQKWFYINRKNFLYIQISNENGEIHLYNNPFRENFDTMGSLSHLEINF